MIVEFCKWGNSLAVRIPKALADAIKASECKRGIFDLTETQDALWGQRERLSQQ